MKTLKTLKTLLTVATLMAATSTVFAASHAGAPMPMNDTKTEMAAPAMMSNLPLVAAEVRKVDLENKKITLKHGEIKNLDMPGMSMVFQVKDPAMLSKVKTGDKVTFTAEKLDGAIVVTQIQVVK